MLAELLADLLREARFNYRTEDDLQRGVAKLLTAADISYERELRLPDDAGRIDFLVSRSIGIECKIKGPARDAWRQCARYLETDAVKELILVTTKSSHRPSDGRVAGKRLHIVWLSGGAL